MKRESTGRFDLAVKFETCIEEGLGSYLGRDTAYRD
jgi:hypothetical protein